MMGLLSERQVSWPFLYFSLQINGHKDFPPDWRFDWLAESLQADSSDW